MPAILAFTATPHQLRAVLRDGAPRLWMQFDYVGEPGARCLVDGRTVAALDPPRSPREAVRLVADLVRRRGCSVVAVAHHIPADQLEHAMPISDTLLACLDDGGGVAAALAVVDAARASWPDVPHFACFGTEPDAAAVMDRQVRELLLPADQASMT